MASLLKTRIIEVLKGLEVYALTKTLQAIESDSSSNEKDTLVDVLMSDIVDIGMQIVLSRLQPSTLKLIIKNAHLDPENEEQSQAELEEHITAIGVREYLLNIEQKVLSGIIKDLGIESSPREIVVAELEEEVILSGLEYMLQRLPVLLLQKYYGKSLQIKSTSQKKQSLVEEIIRTIVAGYLSSIVPDNEIDSPRSAEKAARRRSSVSNKRHSIVVRRRSNEYSPSAEPSQILTLDPLDDAQPRALTYYECEEDDVPMESDIEVEDLAKEFGQSLSINQESTSEVVPEQTPEVAEDSLFEDIKNSEGPELVEDQAESKHEETEVDTTDIKNDEGRPSVDAIDASVASDDATVGAERIDVEVESDQDELNASMETSQDGADEMSIDVVTTEASVEPSQAEVHEAEAAEQKDESDHQQNHEEAQEESEDEEQAEGGVGIHAGISKKELESMLVKDLKSYMKEHGLNYNGRKVLLVKRILEHLEEQKSEQPEPEAESAQVEEKIPVEEVIEPVEEPKEEIVEEINHEEKHETIVEEVVPKSARKRGRPRKNPLPEEPVHEAPVPETPSTAKGTRRRRGAHEEEAEKEVKRSTAKKMPARSKSAQKRRKTARTSVSDEHDISELREEKSSPTKTADKPQEKSNLDSEDEESYEFDNKENENYEVVVPTPPRSKSKAMPTPKFAAFSQPYTPTSQDLRGILKSPMTPRTKRKSVTFHATVKNGSPLAVDAQAVQEPEATLIDVNSAVSVLQPVNINTANNAPEPKAVAPAKPSTLQKALHTLNKLRTGNLFS
jgi:hypothetical protein